MKKGFTLVELLVTITIIGILSSALFIGRTKSEQGLALQKSAYQLSQNFREMQEKAMGAKKEGCSSGELKGFGVFLNLNSSTSYRLFRQCDGNKEEIREVKLANGVELTGLSPSSPLTILFSPPDPTTSINGEKWGKSATTTLSLKSNPAQTKKVSINSAGKIEIK